MSKRGIPMRPELLAAFLGDLIAGDDKHQQDKPLPKDTRAELEATKAKLESLNHAVQTSKGQARQDTKDRHDYVKTAHDLAVKYRGGVIGLYGAKDPVLVDYGLPTRRKTQKAVPGETGSVSEAQNAVTRLSNAQARVNRQEARLERDQARLDKSKAILAQRKIDAANVQPIKPTEPTPTAAPTSESGPK